MNDEEIGRMLEREIKNELSNLSNLETGSGDKSKAIDDLTKLYKLRMEEIKTEGELDEKQSARYLEDNHNDDELEFRRETLKEQRIDRYLNLGMTAAGAILSMIFYSKCLERGFKFEETGSITSETGRGLFRGVLGKFNPIK